MLRNAVTRFTSENHLNTVICFTDSTTTGSEVGTGCAAMTVILPGHDNMKSVLPNYWSIETELTATALAIERVIDLFTSGSVDAGMNTIIFTDCKAALTRNVGQCPA